MSVSPSATGEVSLDQILAALQDLTCTEDINLGELLQAFLNTNTAFTFNSNDGNVFAKVAMLIQSSATVYCRKVEFLYSLVLQMLELLKSKESRKDKGDKGGAEKTKKALPLENAKNIDIKEDCCKSNSKKDQSTVPVSLLTMDDIEKGDEFICSSKGENVGNNKDFPLLAYVQPVSMMLLEQCSLKFLFNEDHLRNQFNDPSAFSQLAHDEDTMDCNNDAFDPVTNHDASNDDNIADDHFDNADNVSVRNYDMVTRNAAGNNLRNPPEVKSDPWTNLNHHVEINNLAQTLKPALRFTRRPVTKLNRKRTRKKTDKTDDICRITNFMSNAYYSHSAKLPKREILPNDSALESLFYDEYQARQKVICKKRFPETLSSNGESSPLPDLPGMDMDGDSDFDDVINNNDPFDENQDQFNMQSLGNLSPILGSDDDRGVSPLDNTVAVGYEDLVRKYVERYLESAALYIQTTELTKRVREWEKKILPVLATEDQHDPYDIHVYGSKVLNNFNNNNRKETKNFSDIVKDKEPFETARILLATLQLANNYNVEISGVHPAIEITLLSRKRHLDLEEVMEYDAHATHKAR